MALNSIDCVCFFSGRDSSEKTSGWIRAGSRRSGINTLSPGPLSPFLFLQTQELLEINSFLKSMTLVAVRLTCLVLPRLCPCVSPGLEVILQNLNTQKMYTSIGQGIFSSFIQNFFYIFLFYRELLLFYIDHVIIITCVSSDGYIRIAFIIKQNCLLRFILNTYLWEYRYYESEQTFNIFPGSLCLEATILHELKICLNFWCWLLLL